MKQILQSLLLVALFISSTIVFSQSNTFEKYIVTNGEPDTIDVGPGFPPVVINTSSDDAEQEDMAMDALDDDDLDAGWEGDPTDLHVLSIGLRFTDITIPNNAAIDSAFIYVSSHEEKLESDVADIDIYGEASDNPATYDLDNLITDRPRTTAMVNWICDEYWELYGRYRTADISPIVQELVDRPGWTSGNAMAFMLLGKDDQGPSDDENAREMEAFENIADPEDGGDGQHHPERIPQLVVYYHMVSIDENGREILFNMYPNPANNGLVYVSLLSEKPSEVLVYGIAGNVIQSISTDGSTSITLNIDEMAKGMYFVKVVQDNNAYTRKLIVK